MMNPKKKADLQRKLTLAQVPKPPADLLDRIKRDIPPHLVMGVASDRDRFTRSIFFDARIAASVLLIVTSAFLALQFFSRTGNEKSSNTFARRPPQIAAAPATQPATLTDKTAAEAPAQVAQLRERPTPVLVPRNIVADRQHDEEPSPSRDRRDSLGTLSNTENEPAVAGGTAAPPAPAAPVPESVVVEAAPPPVPAPVAAAAAPSGYAYVPPQPAASRASIIPEAKAYDFLMKQPDAVFGISIDRQAFERIKTAIEHGEQPESQSIDVAALVNYFAGSPKHTRSDVRVEVEGSPAPVAGDATRRMIRVSVDTASADVVPGASIPPVATGASIAADFDKSAVVAHHLVGGDGSLPMHVEPTLLKNTSVTALYDVALAPHGMAWQRICTFKVTYTAVTDGKEHTIEKTLRRRDLKQTWLEASRRHRLASLGAVWGETLKGMAGANDVARRAEELAMQAPEDAKARELANAASATSQLHGTASGSAR